MNNGTKHKNFLFKNHNIKAYSTNTPQLLIQLYDMKTLVLSTSEHDIEHAATLLQQGNLVAFPTETVYGLGADIFCEDAVNAIYRVKGRPSDNPLIVHIAHIEDIYNIAINISDQTKILMETCFPGPLTVVLTRHPSLGDSFSKGLSTIAVRMPSHPAALSLIKKTGHPIAAPSANISGKPSPTTAQHVLEDLDGKISAVIDGGNCAVGIESTVIDMTHENPMIVRPGHITAEEISTLLHQEVAYVSPLDHSLPIISPGMKYRHYAPHATIDIIDADELHNRYIDESVILSNILVNRGVHTELFPLTTQTLFAAFRLADMRGYTQIVIVLDEKSKAQEGLMNRIRKATA